MTDLPADRYIEEALRRVGSGCILEDVKWDYAQLGAYRELIELARMIEKHEPIPEPVDPDLLIVREVAADRCPHLREEIIGGGWDDMAYVQAALRHQTRTRERKTVMLDTLKRYFVANPAPILSVRRCLKNRVRFVRCRTGNSDGFFWGKWQVTWRKPYSDVWAFDGKRWVHSYVLEVRTP